MATVLLSPTPLLFVEVLSPGTAYQDVGIKLLDYFTLPSVQHYLILNPVICTLQHFSRNATGNTDEKTYTSGRLTLTPPGITISVEEIF